MGHAASTSAPVTKDTGRIQVQSASQTVGSGSSADIIPAAANPAGLLIWAVTMTASASGTAGGFAVEDMVTSSDGALSCDLEVALSSAGGNAPISASFDCQGMQVAAGAAVTLANGGGGGSGALRRSSATVFYTTLV